jgi:hypothetical protein
MVLALKGGKRGSERKELVFDEVPALIAGGNRKQTMKKHPIAAEIIHEALAPNLILRPKTSECPLKRASGDEG